VPHPDSPKKKPGEGSPGHVDVTGEGEEDIYAFDHRRASPDSLSRKLDFVVAVRRSRVAVRLQPGARVAGRAAPNVKEFQHTSSIGACSGVVPAYPRNAARIRWSNLTREPDAS